MQTTPNYGLNKPEATDAVNIADLNENADIIDAELIKHAEKPTIVNSITGDSLLIADNTEYRLTGIYNLEILFPSGNFECWMKLETTTDTSRIMNITFPNDAKFIGELPTFGKLQTWEISIKDGVIIAVKVE